MTKIWVKTAIKALLILAIVFFMANWIQADELSAIKDGKWRVSGYYIK